MGMRGAALCSVTVGRARVADVQRAARSRSAHPAYAAYARLEKVPRKTPEKPVDNAMTSPKRAGQ